MTTQTISLKNVSLEVNVYCESLSAWVPAKVVEFPTANTVRVQFCTDGGTCAKDFFIRPRRLDRPWRRELDPEGFLDNWICGRSAEEQARANIGPSKSDEEDDAWWMKDDPVEKCCGKQHPDFYSGNHCCGSARNGSEYILGIHLTPEWSRILHLFDGSC